jgi:adenylate kinase
MNIILLGAPGAGKGTQAEIISKELGIQAISTGNILREAVKNGTALGKKAKSFMDEGKLVPDEVLIGIIKDRLAQDDTKKGFILDGFPRTVPQAEALDSLGVKIDKVLEIHVGDDLIIERMAGRRVCEKCGAPYHILSNPSKDGVTCDIDGGKLIQRKDDAPETVRARLAVYHELTEPLKGYYEKQGRLVVVEGAGAISDTTERVFKELEG